MSTETELLRRYAETGDPALKEELVHRFLPLARSLALRYRGSSEDIEDLIQVASLGLVKALDGFDLERGRSFMAYAAPTILGELRRHFRDRVWEVRLPRGLQERTMAVSEAAGALSDELGAHARRSPRSPSAWTGRRTRSPRPCRPTRRVARCRWRCREAGRTRGPRRSWRRWARPSPATTRWRPSSPPRALRSTSASAASCRLRFEQDLNQYEIGRRLGVSQMQVSRIMRRALRKLLAAVQAEPADEAEADRPT